MEGDFFIGASLATVLTKLAIRYREVIRKEGGGAAAEKKENRFIAEAMLVLASILHLGKSGLPSKAITEDDADRISLCLKVLAEQSEAAVEVFDKECRAAVGMMLEAQAEVEVTFFKTKNKLIE